MSNRRIFQSVGSLIPGRSMFDLSYEKKFTCDMGQLIPVQCDEVVPGDYWEMGNEAVIRFQPLVAPPLHEVNMYTHTFFVPYRLLWDNGDEDSFEAFITGGVTGDLTPTIPIWEPTNTASGSLWDFMGFPVGIDPDGAYPVDFPRRAYNFVWNEFYRDESLQAEVALTNEAILNSCWEKDYLTSSLLEQQRGTSPALPISGHTSAVWQAADFSVGSKTYAMQFEHANNTTPVMYTQGSNQAINALNMFNSNIVDLSTATTFDIADLRLAFQIQKWLERNNRAGARYTEFLRAHFGVSPKDDRLQRPEYIGGTKKPVIFSEVLQTSSTDVTSPQGNLAGHGLTVAQGYTGKYHVKEFGLIITFMKVMPRTAYQDGINRQWLKSTKYDFYFPEFANLSEQAVLNAEVCATGVSAHNTGVFGYQGRYDEMRTKDSMVCSGMRMTFDYWHLGRQFDTGAPPTLNNEFVECVPRKDIFAVPTEPGLIVSFGNRIKAFRPLPLSAEPGLIDHH
nr:MAG: major capsid protein [Microvirus sp.]